MKKRILIAGVGNVFCGDDGFGVEVVRRLVEQRSWRLPDGVAVADFGTRALHLAFELLERQPLDLFILVDAMARGGEPGTLYVMDPGHEKWATPAPPDAHTMTPVSVFTSLHALGGTLPRTRIVGCEPADVRDGMCLSDEVREALEPAVRLVHRLVHAEVSNGVDDDETDRRSRGRAS